MNKRTLALGIAGLLALTGIGFFLWNGPAAQNAVAQAPRSERTVPVTVIKATKALLPVRIEALGTVTAMASVAIKSRTDSEVVAVKFEDGALVNRGDVLFELDSRAIEAQIQQVEGNIQRDMAQIEGAERDIRRFSDLVAKNATPVTNLDNAKTQAAALAGSLKANQAALRNLQVQLSYCTIRAPISGRISMANAKIGNVVRQADPVPMATINQVAPIYVSFAVSQRNLVEVRAAMAAGTAKVEAKIPGADVRATGLVTMIENTVDPATGMVMVRATMPNTDEHLWPGKLVGTVLTLRNEQRVTVPASAVQISQAGSFVFVVQNNTAVVRPVKVAWSTDGQAAIESGLEDGEIVVTDGQLQLSNGTRVTIRGGRAAS